ncbi:MAG: aa3-type cytochrome c oxidase subunit IV [Maricaulaceae bacterium]
MAGDDNYVRGEMNISEQSRTFSGFMTATKWASLAVVALVFFLTLVFAVPVPLLGAIPATAVLVAIGFFVLRS